MTGENRDLATLADIVERADAGVDDEAATRARTVVAAHAHDGEDLRMLLDVLGLGRSPD
ncbi:hypothetical protein [Kitasatospora sp. KL5]|uniref:hypothetical protein n=1 Tax=Kitasatospora sp. KL5 TaxID=3425125 RepID=UPI003D6FFC3F